MCVVDLCFNRIWLKITHVVYCFIVFVSYIFVTYIGQNLLSYPIYYQMLNYYCDSESESCWKNCGYYLTLLICLQILFFLVLWGILFMRQKLFLKKENNTLL